MSAPTSRPAPALAIGATADAAKAAAHGTRPHDRAAALLPPCLFAVALAFFALALVTMPFVARELQEHFYQAHVLAVTHMLTLGWISMVIVGVLYRYVPAISKVPLPFPRLATVQALTFVGGAAGLVAAFWFGNWTLTAAAAGTLLVSALLLCANLWPLALGAPRRGVAEIGVLLATAFLVTAAALGTVFAVDKQYSLIGGSLMTNLAAHVHVAAIGWVGITICALSFRFLPAFLLPTVQTPDAARTQVGVLAATVAALAMALLARSGVALVAAFAVAAALVAYLVLLVRMMRSHRMPLDWTARHAGAAAAWLLAAIAAAGTLVVVGGAETAVGVRVSAAYGVAGLLGWMSNLIIGMSYKLFPGFVAAARADLERRRAPVGELGPPAIVQAPIFAGYNAGVLLLVAGLLMERPAIVTAATVAVALAGLTYVGVTARTVAFTVIDPTPPRTALRILG